MRPHRAYMLLLLAIASGTTHAGIIHRCRQLDGVIAYRDTGCTPEETLVSQLEVAQQAVEASAAQPTAGRTPSGKGASGNAGKHARTARQARSARSLDRIVAHECRFGEQRWVQAEACPASLAVAATRGAKPAKQRVDETRLTGSQVCEVLRSTSSAHSFGEGSARRAYAMNRLRQRHGC